MFWFVLLLILLGGGFYFYQRMVALEREIRAEQEREKELQAQQVNQDTAAAPQKKESAAADVAAENPVTEIAENPILQFICAHPGVIQADLYADVPQLNKKQAQQMIRELVAAGKVRRERLGSSFKLYLA